MKLSIWDKRRFLLVGMISAFVVFIAEAQRAAPLQLVKGKVVDRYLRGVDPIDADRRTSRGLASMQNDGSFPDINYGDRSRGVWQPGWHVERIRAIATSYIVTGGAYFHNP